MWALKLLLPGNNKLEIAHSKISVYVLAWQIVKVDVYFPFDLKTSLECYKKYYQIDCPVYKDSLRCFLTEAAA